MPKLTQIYRCNHCQAEHSKWMGRCDECGEWNTVEKAETLSTSSRHPTSVALAASYDEPPVVIQRLADSSEPAIPSSTGIGEFDRVLGGGLVPASAILVGGDPGIGKSTLLLQATAAFANHHNAYYFTGEEALAQIRLRAQRLGISDSKVGVAAVTNLRDILNVLENQEPEFVVLDSIQTMWSDTVEGTPGSISQVRSVGYEMVRLAKRSGAAVVLVGHVTKEGHLAGPRVVEHMVDTVLYFEGDQGHQFRILRSVKNRFGATEEIGVFEMTSKGLLGIKNPSSLFLSGHDEPPPGSAVFAGLEGTRPLLVEIQALVAPSAYATARRAVVGWDSGRLAMVLAVLEARCGLSFAGQDVFLNVAGGLRLIEPAADLAVAAAIISAQTGRALPPHSAVFGEISLSGQIRPVAQPEFRLKECAKQGFNKIFLPSNGRNQLPNGEIDAKRLSHLNNAVAEFGNQSKSMDRGRDG